MAQRVPRLAGLVRFPASWPVQAAIRQRASWLAKKASLSYPQAGLRCVKISQFPRHPRVPIPFALLRRRNIPLTRKHPNRQGLRMPYANCGGNSDDRQRRGKTIVVCPPISFTLLRRRNIPLAQKPPNPQGLSMPYANCGGESGDRQRREKALPFLKEEKSEHERARTYALSR